MNHTQPVLYSVDFSECGALVALDSGQVTAVFVAALERAGATIVEKLTHAFPGVGITCVLILSESHAVIHTWPETGTVNIDIFSCSSRLKSQEAIDELSRAFGARRVSVNQLPRANGYHPEPEQRR